MAANLTSIVYNKNTFWTCPPNVTRVRLISERPIDSSLCNGSGFVNIGNGQGVKVQGSSDGTGGWSIIQSDGQIYAWGHSFNGALGIGSSTAVSTPTVVPGNLRFTEFSGIVPTLAMGVDGVMYSAGYNIYGQAGTNAGVTQYSYAPVLGNQSGRLVKAFTSARFNDLNQALPGNCYFFQDSQGSTLAAGYNTWGNLGIGTSVTTSTPVYVVGANFSINSNAIRFTKIYPDPNSNNGTTYFIDSAGNAWATGSNVSGRCGTGVNDTVIQAYSSPVMVVGGISFATLIPHVSGGWCLGLDGAGNLYGWGNNQQGQLGTNDIVNRSSPVLIAAGYKFTKITLDFIANFAWTGITTTNQILGCGINTYGNLATGDVISRSSPVLVAPPAGLTWTTMWGNNPVHAQAYSASSGTYLCYAWGSSFNGVAGTGLPAVAYSSPTVLPLPSTIGAIQKISYQPQGNLARVAFAQYGDGTTYSWGLNTAGVLGQNISDVTLASTSTPGLLAGPWKFQQIFNIQNNNALGISTTGQVLCWGGNSQGQCGNGTLVNASSPTLVAGFRQPDLRPIEPDIRYASVIPGQTYAINFGGTTWFGTLPIGYQATQLTLEYQS